MADEEKWGYVLLGNFIPFEFEHRGIMRFFGLCVSALMMQ
jgi:hypothetical protein